MAMGRLHSTLDDPDPYPSGAVGHRHVHLDLDHGPGLALALGMGQGVEFHFSLDRARILAAEYNFSKTMNIVTLTCTIQHTELPDLEFLPMPVQYPLRRLVDLDDADSRTPLRRTDQLLNLSYDDYATGLTIFDLV